MSRGFALPEFLVAWALSGLVMTSLVHMLLVAQTTRQASAYRARALQLAAERVERVRAGLGGDALACPGVFACTTTSDPLASIPGVRRIDVMVTWQYRGGHTLRLSTLVPEQGL
jgi:Tfp pilus assembly protein PilV